MILSLLFSILSAFFRPPSPEIVTPKEGGVFLEVQYECVMNEKEKEQRLSTYLQFITLEQAQGLIKALADKQRHSLYIDVQGGWAVFEEIRVDERGDTISQDLFYQKGGMRNIFATKVSDLNRDKAKCTTVYPPQLTFGWKPVEGETKEILGFNCQKALLSIGDRTYTAWFTPDIPLSYGPKRYMGEGGLILEMDGQAYHYKAIAVKEIKKIPFPLPDRETQKEERPANIDRN